MDNNQSIKRYVYLLIAVILLFTTTLGAYSFVQNRKSQRTNHWITDFHAYVIEHLFSMEAELLRIEKSILFLGTEHSAPTGKYQQAERQLIKLDGQFDLLTRHETEIKALYDKFESQRLELLFLETSKLKGIVEKKFTTFRNSFSANQEPVLLDFGEVILAIKRLRRLHQAEKLLLEKDLEENKRKGSRNLIIFAVIALLICVISIRKIL